MPVAYQALRELLDRLGLRPSDAVALVRRDVSGAQFIEVRVRPSARLPADAPSEVNGVAVRYVRLDPAKPAGRSYAATLTTTTRR